MDHERAASTVESRLVARARDGERSAFDEIVVLHRQAVYGVARRILASHEDADEAAQETFVRAWRSLDGFRGEARLSTWLIRIALNVSRTLAASRRHTVPLDDAVAAIDTGETGEDASRRLEAGRRVRRAVAGLPPRQREVVTLKVFSDMTYEDVASAMGLTVGAVKAHFHQAVANLKRRMTAETSGGGVP